MQTILGSGGAIGIELSKALKAYTGDIRLVSRHPKKVNEADTLFPADLTDPAQASRAVAGSSVCYLTVGLEYKTAVWEKVWPLIVSNVVNACAEHGCKLVFFDNVYAIGRDQMGRITEDSPISPCSRKGEVRAALDRLVLDHIEKGQVQALIARAPDFFGPVRENSMVMSVIYDNLAKGKPAQWLCNADVVHSAGYATELAKGTAMLGNAGDTYGQVWNLPVDPTPITGRQWAALFAEEMQARNALQVLPAFGMRLLGFFVPILGEMYEMRYQYDRDYFFDSGKFDRRFGHTPISHRAAVQATVHSLRA
jgi:nucleoside-diphosphate-sugar epimerase